MENLGDFPVSGNQVYVAEFFVQSRVLPGYKQNCSSLAIQFASSWTAHLSRTCSPLQPHQSVVADQVRSVVLVT
jgi:hypothetical protein